MSIEMPDRIDDSPSRWLLVGMGITNLAVANALLRRGHEVLAVDDSPDDALRAAVNELGVALVDAPDDPNLADFVAQSDFLVPAPGLPESHPVFSLAEGAGCPVVSELDLAAAWDKRPIVAITGTNGKTTVVELVLESLSRSGVRSVAAGNTDLPLVSAIDDPSIDVFVVEASSFRLAASSWFRPVVATWLNFAPDHLDIHADLATYEAAKASIWGGMSATDTAVAFADDAVVMSHLPTVGRVQTFATAGADWFVDDGGNLCGPSGPLLHRDQLWRSLPHDIVNALAAAATASAAGADRSGMVDALKSFAGLAHRVSEVAAVGGSVFYDDSKATTPHATVSALRGFESAVLIAGGRNKEIDLSEMLAAVDHVAAVVAIGEAAEEIVNVFAPHRQVEVATTMDDAVCRAGRLAAGGLPVLLSPGCASFDWYRNYGARGDDFARAVNDLAAQSPKSPSAVEECP